MSYFNNTLVWSLAFFFALFPMLGKGQTNEGVGINTTTIDPNAVLDINSNASNVQGIKMPHYNSTDLQGIDDAGVSEGILFFDGTRKQIYNTVFDDGSSRVEPIGWGMRGNDLGSLSGTDYYLGTNDLSNFEIGTNATTRMEFARTGEISVGTHTPYASDAAFQINTDQGILLPRLTTAERTATTNPTPGLMVYDTDLNQFYAGFYDPQTGGREWEALDRGGGGSGGSDADWTIGSGTIYNTSDNVGIGDASPDGKLEIRQTTTADILNLYDGSLNVLTVVDRGDVGIGDASPDGKLEVRQTTTADILNLYDNTTNVFSVIDGGNVGIGVGGDSDYQVYQLGTTGATHTRGFYNYQIGSPSGTGYGIYNDTRMNTANAVYGLYNYVGTQGTSHKYGIYNFTSGNSSSSGIVYGINQYVYHTGTGDAYGLKLQNNGSGSGIDYGIYSTGEDINYLEGDLGIGVASPEGKLQVDHTGTTPIARFRKSTTTRFMVANNGYTALYYNLTPSYQLQLNVNSAAKPTSSEWIVASDGKLKKDVSNFKDGLDILMNINPVWFSYTGEAGMPTNERGVGTIAQDLQKSAPYMVSEWTYVEGSTDENRIGKLGEEIKYLGVDYGALNFVIVNSIKEQQEMIEQQQGMIEQHQEEINLLQKELELLKEK